MEVAAFEMQQSERKSRESCTIVKKPAFCYSYEYTYMRNECGSNMEGMDGREISLPRT